MEGGGREVNGGWVWSGEKGRIAVQAKQHTVAGLMEASKLTRNCGTHQGSCQVKTCTGQ